MKNLIQIEGIVLVVILSVSSSILVMATPKQMVSLNDPFLKNRGYFYAYNIYDPSGSTFEGPITFDTPDDITLLAGGIFPNFCAAADVDEEGNWYGCDYAGGLYLIDQETGAQVYIGPTIGVNGMTYDTTTGTWYITSSNALYTMDVTTGATFYIAYLQGGIGDILCDLNGRMYGVCYNGSAIVLCLINKNTGMIEEIGPTGLSSSSDLGYDRNNDIVYCVGSKPGESGFFVCDIDNGECSLIGGFEGGAEIDGVVIPYAVPSHFLAAHFSWVPSEPLPLETVFFDATRSFVIGGEIVLYEWDWDSDGVYDEADSVPTTTHVWDAPGSYPVTLRVTDDTGFTAVKSHVIDVVRENHPPIEPNLDGPTNGIVNRVYIFSAGPLLDPDEDAVYCQWDWGDGNSSDWIGPYASGQIIPMEYSWTSVGVYDIRVKLKDIYEAESNWSDPHEIRIVENKPPEIPTIDGPATGKPNVSYLYVFMTTDLENDDVLYYVDWGDTTNSGWMGPYGSGVETSASHHWNQQGTYTVKIKAKDIYGQESDWETLSVTMPCELHYFRFFDWLFERFPFVFPILRYVLNV